MGGQNPLLQLRDIHMPEPVSMWPLAPGWWLLLAFALILAGLLIMLFKKLKGPMTRRSALKELQLLSDIYAKEGDMRKLATDISILLKRVALVRFEKEKVAGLHGKDWQKFLLETGHDMTFTDKEGELLAMAPYVSSEAFKGDKCGEKLLSAAHTWIRHNT